MGKHGGQAIVEVMKKEGVTKIFGVPGESYLNVLDAIYEESSLQFISARQEGGASFMAEAYAKTMGDVGVCTATRGPGATNLSVGLHTAFQDSTPIVALIGQVEKKFKDREAFQEVEFSSYFSHLCKWAVEIDDAKRIPELLHRAFHVARSGRPGPVVVSLPEDMQDEMVEDNNYAPIKVKPNRPNSESVKETIEALKQAEKPVIIAGGGVILSKATQNLIKLSEVLQIPVATAFRRFHAFPNTHGNYIGALGLGVRKGLQEYIQESDLVLALGTKFSQMTTDDYTLINEQSKLVHVDISPDVIGKVYKPYISVVSDANEFLNDVLEVVQPEENPGRTEMLKEANSQYVDFSTPQQSSGNQEGFADMKKVISDLKESLPDDAIITSDAGNFFSWISRYYRYGKDEMYLGPTSGAMGYGMPSAIGAKIAEPDKKVVSISGDGGFMMTVQEFETAVRYNTPIISLVINNNKFGTIRAHQEGKFPDRVIGTDLTNPDFAELAKNFGGYGIKVNNNEDFSKALREALENDKPTLIEVAINPEILSANQEK